MLPLVRNSIPHLSWRATVALILLAACAIAVPTVYLTRPTWAEDKSAPAAAREDKTRASVDRVTKPINAITFEGSPQTVAVPPKIEFYPPLTPAEQKITAALEEKTDMQFDNTPLSDAVRYLSDLRDIPIDLDKKGLADIAVDQDVPITRNLKGIALKSGLKLILDELELTFIINDEVLKITSHDKADEVRFTRVYPVGDLILADPTGKLSQWGPLLQMVTSTIAPDTWDESGGAGSIQPVQPSKSLVINQTRDVHDRVLELLRALRAAQHSAEHPGAPQGATPKEKDKSSALALNISGPAQCGSNPVDFFVHLHNRGDMLRDVKLILSIDEMLEMTDSVEGFQRVGKDLMWVFSIPPQERGHIKVRCRGVKDGKGKIKAHIASHSGNNLAEAIAECTVTLPPATGVPASGGDPFANAAEPKEAEPPSSVPEVGDPFAP